MNMMKLALLSLSKKSITLILVILELVALFIAENYMVSALKERSMLSAPYQKHLSENSAFVMDTDYMVNLMTQPDLTLKESREQLLEGVKGNYTIYDTLSYSDDTYTIYSLSDEIYSGLALPLLGMGTYLNGQNSAVAAYNVPIGNYTIKTKNGSFDLKVCGNLTESTFIPEMLYYDSNGMTTKDFYYASTNEINFIITNRSAIQGFEELFACNMGFLIEFEENPDENISLLQSKGSVIAGTSILENTNRALSEDKKSFFPLIGCILMIVLIGTICISLTIFNENFYRNGILWICGYTRSKLLIIHSMSIVLLLILSLVAGSTLLYLFNIININSVFNISLGIENLAATVLTCIFLIAATMIIPVVKTARTSPIEYIRRAK